MKYGLLGTLKICDPDWIFGTTTKELGFQERARAHVEKEACKSGKGGISCCSNPVQLGENC